MFNKTLHEILTTRIWFMSQSKFQAYEKAIRDNILANISVPDIDDKKRNVLLGFTNKQRIVSMSSESYMDGASFSLYDDEPCSGEEPCNTEKDEEVVKTVLVLYACGPITRNGDACSYGSIDHRDLLLQAAEDDSCAGVVFVLDTPGGNAFALYDYKQGMDAIKAAGKRSIAFVDGCCESCGVVISCQCDYTIAYNENHLIGCIGSMMAGWATPDGAVAEDGSRYVFITADQSPDKNIEFRECAAGNYKKMQAEVNETCNDFLSLINECRPQIKESHRTGMVYKMRDVMGSLCDGIGSFEHALDYVTDGVIGWSVSENVNENVNENENQNENAPSSSVDGGAQAPDDKCKPKCNADDNDDKCKPKCDATNNENSKTDNNMNIENICKVCGIDAADLHTEENGFFLNEAHADMIDAALNAANTELAEVREQLTSANTLLEDANTKLAETEDDNAKLNEELDSLNAKLTEVYAENDKLKQEIDDCRETVDGFKAEVTQAIDAANAHFKSEMEAKDAEIANLNAEIEELAKSGAQAQMPEPETHDAAKAPAEKSYQDMSIEEKKAFSIYR